MPFLWDENREVFIDSDSGEELSLEDAEDLVDELIDDAAEDIDIIIEEFLDTEAPKPDGWHAAFILLLKDLFLTLGALGIGGIALLDTTLSTQIQDALDRQLGYLAGFAVQVSQGRLSIRGIKQRSHMYTNSTRQSYWLSRDEFERRRSMVQERWITRGDNHVCSPCNDAEDENWRTIGTFAQPGSGIVMISPTTMCLGLTSCRCRKEYR